MSGQGLPATERIRRRPEFERVYDTGARAHGRFMTVFTSAERRRRGSARRGGDAEDRLGGRPQPRQASGPRAVQASQSGCRPRHCRRAAPGNARCSLRQPRSRLPRRARTLRAQPVTVRAGPAAHLVARAASERIKSLFHRYLQDVAASTHRVRTTPERP